jgi:hypothetical protein
MIGDRYPIVCEGFIIPPQSDCLPVAEWSVENVIPDATQNI